MKTTEDKNQEVSAEVTFLSATGLDPMNETITSKNIKELLPDHTSVTLVKNFFEKEGISFQYYQGISATITAKKELFESFFDIKLIYHKRYLKVEGQNNGYDIPLKNLPVEIEEQLSNISLSGQMESF
ncbi:hypothetical protein LCGC14_0757300 [marine sediment metagenome]|uniref:Uncharacterized protein n=2 Tax=root TaxID=1 RepID=A0A831VSQ7_9FLAO|nr:hypothetical protein [Pricia sp.]HEA22352.1 hypothetical protein [Pricia antarctica]